jgi:hypothetical protein
MMSACIRRWCMQAHHPTSSLSARMGTAPWYPLPIGARIPRGARRCEPTTAYQDAMLSWLPVPLVRP